jgi:hypothetical protein
VVAAWNKESQNEVARSANRIRALILLLTPDHHSLSCIPLTHRHPSTTKSIQMSKPSTPSNANASSSNSTLLLRRQLQELTKRPVEGFSAGQFRSWSDQSQSNRSMYLRVGLVDDDNLYEWEVLLIGCAPILIRRWYWTDHTRLVLPTPCSTSHRVHVFRRSQS